MSSLLSLLAANNDTDDLTLRELCLIREVTVGDSVAASAHSIPRPTDVAKMEHFIRGLDKQSQSSGMSVRAAGRAD